MDKEELRQKITNIEEELAELKEQLNSLESNQSKIWQPKKDEDFWLITGYGSIVNTVNCLTLDDKRYVETGNCFKTEEEAKKQAEYTKVMNRFRKYVETYSEPLDWGNSQVKYYVCYNYSTCKITFDFINSRQDAFQVYASSSQILEDAIIYSAGSEEEFARIVFGVNNE